MRKIDGAEKISPCLDEWVPKNNHPKVFSETKDRHEKRHLQPKESDTWDDPGIGLKTFIHIHNRKSNNELNTEK